MQAEESRRGRQAWAGRAVRTERHGQGTLSWDGGGQTCMPGKGGGRGHDMVEKLYKVAVA